MFSATVGNRGRGNSRDQRRRNCVCRALVSGVHRIRSSTGRASRLAATRSRAGEPREHTSAEPLQGVERRSRSSSRTQAIRTRQHRGLTRHGRTDAAGSQVRHNPKRRRNTPIGRSRGSVIINTHVGRTPTKRRGRPATRPRRATPRTNHRPKQSRARRKERPRGPRPQTRDQTSAHRGVPSLPQGPKGVATAREQQALTRPQQVARRRARKSPTLQANHERTPKEVSRSQRVTSCVQHQVEQPLHQPWAGFRPPP